MDAVNYFVAHGGLFLLIVFIAGVVLAFFGGCEWYTAIVTYPMIAGLAWFVASLAVNAYEKESAQAALVDDLTKRCEVIGRRDPQSFIESAQVGYRCPAEAGKPAQELWINQ